MVENKLTFFLSSVMGGGAERVFITIANDFASKGMNVDLVLANGKGPYLEEISKSVNVVDLSCKQTFSSINQLSLYLQNIKPQVLFSTQMHTNVVALMAVMISSHKPLVVLREANAVQAYESGFKNRIVLLIAKFLYKKADKIIALHEAMKKEIIDVFHVRDEKITIINNPVSIEKIRKLSKKENQINLFTGGSKFILGIGRLDKQKDFKTLILAYNIIYKKFDNIKLVILGEGILYAEIKNLIENLGLTNQVILPGFISNPFPWIKSAEMLVSTSKFEGFPNVLIQALALDVSVIATNCPGASAEILEYGKLGTLISIGDVNGLVKALMANLTVKKDTLFSKGVESSISKYRVENISAQYHALI
jgi:glycosyltransferase involved in cell wall biosynthesis